MKTAIISPHTDDAIFSLGSTIASKQWGQISVISPFAGVPGDEVGKKKHTLLRQEHDRACELMGIKVVNGDFLDDVYPDRDLNGLESWLRKAMKRFDNIFIPLGIHHPDHILIRNIYIDSGAAFTAFYEELPYRMLYPDKRDHLTTKYVVNKKMMSTPHVAAKELGVESYESQIIGHHILKDLYVEERLWL